MEEAIRQVRDALATGELGYEELTARNIGDFLGKTTSVVYHHWGSLDSFLFAVSESGYELLAEQLVAEMEEGGLEAVGAQFVRFGLESPALYAVMLERRYDWDALREKGAFEKDNPGITLWETLGSYLEDAGSASPREDARIIFAGLHGLVSLASTGRANIGDLASPDREVALESARRLVRRMTGENS